MKNKALITAVAALALMCIGCENQLEQNVKFDATAQGSSGGVSGTAITVKAGEPVTFNFSGDPDFITFFSGEPGHEYSKTALYEVPADEITSVLKFDNMPQYGIMANSLKLYFSTEFTGLKGAPNENKQADSTMVVTHAWKDVSDLANFSTRSNGTNQTEIPLNEYLGKKLTIAFKYDPKQNTATQPTWVISGLVIENTLKSTGVTSQIAASTMGFKALDLLSATPYKNDGGGGVWDLRNIASATSNPPFSFRVQSSSAGQPINEDWLISNPILINSRPGDTGIGIKKIAVDLASYVHTYNTPGTYTVTFVARNANYVHTSEQVKELKITVE